MRRAGGLALGWALALATAALFAWLGLWQTHRAVDKQAMLDGAARVLQARVARSPAVARQAGRARAYDWVQADGRFVQAPAFLLDNQQSGGRPGVRVYRLFQTLTGGAWLVDLGWLPVSGDRRLPTLGAPPAVTRLRGLLAPPPSAGLRLGPPMARSGPHWLMTRLDLDAIRAQAPGLSGGLAPRVLRLDPALPVGYARDLDVLPNTLSPDKHRAYAVQWFGLAATVLVVALVLTFRRPRP